MTGDSTHTMKPHASPSSRSRGPLARVAARARVVAVACVLAVALGVGFGFGGAHVARAAAPGDATDAVAIEDGGRFEMRTATLEPVEGVLQLNASVDLSLSRSALRALADGVPVIVELNVSVNRKRRYLADEEVAYLVQRWQIQYHALSERYLVANLNTGAQTSYSTVSTALAALSQVRGLPVVDQALLEDGQRYEASVRAIASIEGGLPNALRVMMFWMDWKRTTDWYTWTVRT